MLTRLQAAARTKRIGEIARIETFQVSETWKVFTTTHSRNRTFPTPTTYFQYQSPVMRRKAKPKREEEGEEARWRRGTGEQFPPETAANRALWAQERVWRSGFGKEFLTPALFIMIARRGEELPGEAPDSYKVHIEKTALKKAKL